MTPYQNETDDMEQVTRACDAMAIHQGGDKEARTQRFLRALDLLPDAIAGSTDRNGQTEARK